VQGAYGHPDTRNGRQSLTVSEIMSSPVITAKEKTSVREIAKLMKKHRIDAVVVTNKINEPIGMVTGGDIVNKLVSRTRNLLFSKAKHIMSKPVVTVKRQMLLEDAARYMATNRIKKLCVVDDSNKAVGIITSSDITKNASYLIDVLEEIIETGYMSGEAAVEEER
jgi:CBS domain-containing protein